MTERPAVGFGRREAIVASTAAPIVDGAVTLDDAAAAALLPVRSKRGHKGDFGKLLVVAGSIDYAGAALLVCRAAGRAGAGLVTLAVPEPNTWREIVKALYDNAANVPLTGKRIAVQEHGEPSPELYAALRDHGAEVVAVRVYRWELPEDTGPLKNAIRQLTEGVVDVVIFTSSVQYVHAAHVAAEMGLSNEFAKALSKAVVASIGPTTSQTLRENGIRVDLEPSHPKMGFLVKEAADRSSESVLRKSTP